jgi:hypothetical protein
MSFDYIVLKIYFFDNIIIKQNIIAQNRQVFFDRFSLLIFTKTIFYKNINDKYHDEI